MEAREARAVRHYAKRVAKTSGHRHWPLALSMALLLALCSLPVPRTALAQGWLTGYDKRVKLTIDHNDVTSSLTEFPVLVYLSTASGRGSPQDDLSCVFNELQNSDANRKKIAVTKSDGITQCYVEIERWDSTNKKAWLWVNVPSVSSTVDTDLYLYYDKDHADNTAYVGDTDSTPAQSVWNTNYLAVFHMSQTPTGTVYDSTGNNKDLTPNNLDAADLVDAKIGKGINFDSSDTEYLKSGTNTITIQAFTYELWNDPQTLPSGWEVLMNFDTGGVNFRYFALDASGGNCLGYDGEGGLTDFGSGYVTQNEWQFFCLTYDGANMRAYRNSVQYGSSVSKTIQQRTDDFEIASYKLGQEKHDGVMDEVRISNIRRDSVWLTASYESERDHLIDYGNEESMSTSWLSGWRKRVKLTLDHNDFTSDLTNFPVLIYLSTASGRGSPQDDLSCVFNELTSDANRKKIAVTTSDGTTQCYVEIEKWENANKKAWLWVNVPSVSSTADTILYLYYDSSQADNTNYVGDPTSTPAQSVWDSNFKGVFHLGETSGGSGAIKNSTTTGNGGTDYNSPTFGATGEVDGAINFDGTNDYINLGKAFWTITSAITIEGWVKTDVVEDSWWFNIGQDDATYKGAIVGGYANAKVIFGTGNGASYQTLQSSGSYSTSLIYVAATWDGSTKKIYLNGAQDANTASFSGTLSYYNAYTGIGVGYATGGYFDGIIDEVRISNTARNAAWIKASYESERDHLIDYGSEEAQGTTLLTFNSKYVVAGTTAVQTTSTSLVNDTQASQTFSLTASQTVLVIYQANSVSGAAMPWEGMQNAIWVDGVDYARSWDSPFDDDYFNARNAVFWIGTLASGSHTIKGRFASDGDQAATINNRILLIYILNGDAYYYLDSSATQTTSSSSLQDDSSASFTFTPPDSCRALILYNVANSYGVTEDGYGKKAAINIGGTDYSQAEKAAAADDCPDSIFTMWALSLSASSTKVTGRFASNRVGETVSINRRQLGVLMFADDTLLDTVSSNSQVSTTSSSLVHDDYATISRTTTDARELLVVAMGTKRNDTLDSKWGECYGIMVDGIDRANSRGSCAYTYAVDGLSPSSAATAYAIYMSASSHTIRGRFSNNYQTYTAKIDSRRIVALWLSTTPAPQPTTNIAFVDGGSVGISTGVTALATLSTSSFDSGNNFVIAVVQLESTASTSIAEGNLKLARGGTILMSNQYIMPISSSSPHKQKWYVLMALDTSAPANPTYFVNATAAATGISGEAKILAISGLTGSMDQGSSTLINGPSWPASTTLASLSTSLPAGDNIVLAIVESINDGDSAAQSISICRLYHKLGSLMAEAQYYMSHDQVANVGRWHAHLIPYLDVGASASAIYNVTCTATKANVIHGRATIVAFSKGSLSAAYIDGASTSIGTSGTIINKLSCTSFQSGSDVAVIASEQFWNLDGSNSNSINADLNKLQQDNSSSGQATNQYTITTSLYGSPDNGKGFGLLNRFTSTASPQYEVWAQKSSSYTYMGESKILALCKPPKVPEFPLGPALLLAVCSPILFAVRSRWKRAR